MIQKPALPSPSALIVYADSDGKPMADIAPRRFVMRTVSVAICVLVLLTGSGQSAEKPSSKSVKDILENATFELYSLDPAKEDDEKGFHGYAVLGKTVVKDADVRKEMIASLYKAIAENDGTAADCFVPRHAIRATHKGKTVDVLICFQCYQVKFLIKAEQGTEKLTRVPRGFPKDHKAAEFLKYPHRRLRPTQRMCHEQT